MKVSRLIRRADLRWKPSLFLRSEVWSSPTNDTDQAERDGQVIELHDGRINGPALSALRLKAERAPNPGGRSR